MTLPFAAEPVLFVSAGMTSPKKRDHVLARRQLYLNYGALSLASALSAQGRAAVLAHGAHEEPEAFADRLTGRGLLPSRHPVMLSLPSFYALEWSRRFCARLKAVHPESRIVAGGRWVVGPDPDWLRAKVPGIDLVVPGLAEDAIADLVGWRPEQSRAIVAPASRTGRGALPAHVLDHRLVLDFEAFQPSVETSRGCGMRCAFCEERDVPLSGLRPASSIVDHLEETVAQYGSSDVRPYLQSSFFLPNRRWADQMAREVDRRGVRVRWRCETRVDAMTPETVAALAEAGMKVVDLGLESASPRQIRAMRKAADPDRYLRGASDLVEACGRHGVWVKANVLLYAGEDDRSVEETTAWLDQHAASVKGVSVGPVVAFGPPRHSAPLLAELAVLGGRVVDPSSAGETGLTAIHPSASMDASAAEQVSLEVSRRLMDEDDYFDLKSFSYYPRNYGRTDFDRDVADADPSRLPFRRSSRTSRRGPDRSTDAPVVTGCFQP